MEWVTPKVRDKRIRRIFAFMTHDCVDGKTRWLCRIWVEEQYIVVPWGGEWKELRAALTHQEMENQ